MTRDARGPGLQIASASVRAPAQRHHDLLEDGLNQVIVVDFTPAEYAKQRVIDYSEQSIIEEAGDAMLASLHGVDYLLVARRLLTLWPARDQAE